MRRLWLVLLLVALLPLRAWAAASMSAPVPALQVPAGAAELLPCHAAPVESAGMNGSVEPVSDAGLDVRLCTNCDLCHAPLAAPAAAWVGPPAQPSSGPPVAHSRDTGRLMAACLERPPRA